MGGTAVIDDSNVRFGGMLTGFVGGNRVATFPTSCPSPDDPPIPLLPAPPPPTVLVVFSKENAISE